MFDEAAGDAYPLSGYSYLVTQCVPAQAAAQNASCDGSGTVTMGTAQGAELSQFIAYVACLGQSKMTALGYAPLPPEFGRGRFPSRRATPGWSDTAAADRDELLEPHPHRR